MAKIPYITGEDRLGSSDKNGWERFVNGNPLETLSQGLECGNIDFKRSDISVPTPWALLVSFDIFLGKVDEENKGDKKENNTSDGENKQDFGDLERNTVNEWRGLLTLIALKKYYGIENELGKTVITINTEKAVDDGLSAADKKFFDTLFELHPQKSIFGTGDEFWDEFSIIKLNREPIGVYSPLTLVCSLYTYENSFALQKLKEIGLVDEEGKFINPVELLKNNMALSLYMSGWLNKLKDCLTKNNNEIRNSITDRIDDYTKDLEASYKANAKDEVSRNMYEPLTRKLFKFNSEFTDKGAKNALDVLQSIKLEKMNLKIPELLEQIKIPTDSNPIFMLEYLGSDVKRLMEISECEKDEGEYWDKSFIFYNKLSLVEVVDGNFPDNMESEFITEISCETEDYEKEPKKKYMCILPINDAVINLIPAKVIGESIKCIQGEETIKFSLSFELNSGKNYILESDEYKKSECNLIAASQIPTVAIWPYAKFSLEGDEKNENLWKDYYVFYAQLKHNEEAREAYAVDVKCDKEDTNLSYQDLTRANGKGDILRKVAQYDKIPTYLSFVEKKSVGFNRAKKYEEKLGIMILPDKQMINQKLSDNVEYMVGLDFGTTSTTAFCKRINDAADSGEIKFIQFGNTKGDRLDDKLPYSENSYPDTEIREPHVGDKAECCFVAYNNSQAGNDEIDRSFVGKKYPAQRAYSSIYRLNTDVNVKEEDKSLKYGNVIYDQCILGALAGGDDTGIMNNLKWGESSMLSRTASSCALSGFLNQIMKTVALTMCKERARNIKWRFSYPTALSENKNDTYQETTNKISDNIKKVCGINSNIDGYYPESVASAKYLGTKSSGQYISVDIGGGSTDVSLWIKNTNKANAFENIMQFSIGIASRKIFLAGMTDAIVNPQELLKTKGNTDECNLQKNFGDLLDSALSGNMGGKFNAVKEKIINLNQIEDAREIMEGFSHVIEMLLQLNSERLKECFKDGQLLEQEKRMYKFLIMGLWGILYYTAKSISCLGFAEKLSGRERVFVNFAGNGSKMYNWLKAGQKKRIKKAFDDVLGNGLHTEFIYREDDLKTEAASGMLLLNKNDDECYNISKEHDGLVDLGKYKIKFDEETKDSDSDGKLVPKDYRSYFETKDIQKKPKEIYPVNQKEDLGEYIKTTAQIVDDESFEDELLEKIESMEFTENIKKVLEDNFNNGTIAPFFIIELEALLRTYLGY